MQTMTDAYNQNGFLAPSASFLYDRPTPKLSAGVIAAIVIAMVAAITLVIITAIIIL